MTVFGLGFVLTSPQVLSILCTPQSRRDIESGLPLCQRDTVANTVEQVEVQNSCFFSSCYM